MVPAVLGSVLKQRRTLYSTRAWRRRFDTSVKRRRTENRRDKERILYRLPSRVEKEVLRMATSAKPQRKPGDRKQGSPEQLWPVRSSNGLKGCGMAA